MDKINLKAPAKINLYLHVLGKRPDGYHNIDSLMQTVSLYDELTLEPSDEIELIGEGAGDLPVSENLAFRAAKLMARLAYFPGVRIVLHKNIPIGAGLGGGSSDAAFVIRGLIKLFNLRVDKDELFEKAAALGADIPFFLGTGQARVTGIGDVIEPFHIPRRYRVLIVKPPFSIDTARVYGSLDERLIDKYNLTNCDNIPLLTMSITDRNFVRLTNHFSNIMEEVVFSWHHELSRIKRSLKEEGAFYAGMSGSGSSVFGLFSPDSGIEKAAAKFNVDRNKVFICEPVVLAAANYNSTEGIGGRA